MTLRECEQTIKDLVETDVNNPEIYEYLYQLILLFLYRKRACRNANDYEEIAYTIAGDLLIYLTDGYEITNYLGYLEKIYHQYIKDYYEFYSKTMVVDLSDAAYLKHLLVENEFDYKISDNKLYLEQIDKVINDVLNNCSKYDWTTSAFMNLKLSLVLSLLNDREVCYHLTEEQSFYLKLIFRNFYEKIHREGNL